MKADIKLLIALAFAILLRVTDTRALQVTFAVGGCGYFLYFIILKIRERYEE